MCVEAQGGYQETGLGFFVVQSYLNVQGTVQVVGMSV